jgi:hypothetical protein
MQSHSTTNKYQFDNNFVEAMPAPPRADMVSARQAADAVAHLITIYHKQQQRVLEGTVLPGDSYAQPGHRLSSGSELAERRRTSAMYLTQQTAAAGLTVGGLVLLAWLTGNMGGSLAFAAWIGATGALSLILSYAQHNRELQLSPEALEGERIAYDGDLALYDAKTRRLILTGELDLRRTAKAAHDAEAALLQQRLESRQPVKRMAIAEPDPLPYTVTETDPPLPAHCATTGDPLLEVLLTSVAALYDRDPDGRLVRISHDGRIDGRLPWSARGDLPPVDKERVQSVLASLQPPLIEQRAGGRYYLNTKGYPLQLALRALRAAWR